MWDALFKQFIDTTIIKHRIHYMANHSLYQSQSIEKLIKINKKINNLGTIANKHETAINFTIIRTLRCHFTFTHKNKINLF